MKQQHTLMKFDPTTGDEKPYPSDADQYRTYHGKAAWLFNPWTADARDAYDIGSDTFGLLILPPGEPVSAAPINEQQISRIPENWEAMPQRLRGRGDLLLKRGRIKDAELMFDAATEICSLRRTDKIAG